jgi:hypothetical protein
MEGADIIVHTWLTFWSTFPTHATCTISADIMNIFFFKFLPASVFNSIQFSVLNIRVVDLWIIGGQNLYLKLLYTEFSYSETMPGI